MAVPLRDLAARVRCRPAGGIVLAAPGGYAIAASSLDELEGMATDRGAWRPTAVLEAAVLTFAAELRASGGQPESCGFEISAETSIPERVGLAGSSALAVAVLRALARLFEVDLAPADLANLALRAETERLGIHGGLMDRVVQAYEQPMYMDLDPEWIAEHGSGRYEPFDARLLPPLFLAWDAAAAGGSERVHNPLRERFERGDPEVRAVMRELAALADTVYRLLLEGRGAEIGPLMLENFELRARIVDVGEANRRLVETARRAGAFAKQAGSGGAVIGTFDGDPQRLERLRDACEAMGARFRVPAVS